MSERREESREANDRLWDKKFVDNEDLGSDGHLSRTEHRRQKEHNSTITTVLIVLIIILAAIPLIYWVNHKQTLNHPVRTERLAESQSSKKKAQSPKRKTSSNKRSSISSSSQTKERSSSTMNSSSPVSSSSSSIVSQTSSSMVQYAIVPRNGSLYRVARQNGISINELMRLNGLTPNAHLTPGQRLRIR
ncbi:LysM peptidoglycan-binding domain-containing protein [Limosilactobacillus fastidiosus]|uniref:LysM peptidoglycan-binding domain-containing protein n=1 Tax=Limosilactobacillus fastidiosus TaxID=2759855 RepID=A0A7W3U095_9LACO|nr:LysM domain-containing protein [Limosilactobacillus fastidiosus]MBB1062756.1 LysM peptidoglycan-binding domain-containing protein [Limosilactobacillus fastidiosus]MBB1086509.1 LysM peptidoglycan-binding domain-containing protein [Limosilactobacillus fastidiosus]MCD7084831.1 LysM peptidoglycan-binding domain-containing protein [Limosilactobacillus fastidiosus]MCD7085139.1 LysM peptidoglycan-binding domain-containing protein [Limosilactobacillus fastidiosus]MCD7115097.1 LysM peptidoglycan-bin